MFRLLWAVPLIVSNAFALQAGVNLDFESGASVETIRCSSGSHDAGFIDIDTNHLDGTLYEDGQIYNYVNKGYADGCNGPKEKRLWISSSRAYSGNRSLIFEQYPTSGTAPNGSDPNPTQSRDKHQYQLFSPQGLSSPPIEIKHYLSFAFFVAPVHQSNGGYTNYNGNTVEVCFDKDNCRPSFMTNLVQLWQGSPLPPPFGFYLGSKPEDFDCGSDEVDTGDPLVLTAFKRNKDEWKPSAALEPVYMRCVQRELWYRIGLVYRVPEFIEEGNTAPSADNSDNNGLLRAFFLNEDGSEREQLFYLQKNNAIWGYQPSYPHERCSDTVLYPNGCGNDGMQVKFGFYRQRGMHREKVAFDHIILAGTRSDAFLPVLP